jgi:hypothetical protein
MNMLPNPKELDAQSPIKIDEWLELGSEKHLQIDDDPSLTKKWFMLLTKNPAYILLDNLGRSWCKNDNGKFCPYHIENGDKKYGIRFSQKASN